MISIKNVFRKSMVIILLVAMFSGMIPGLVNHTFAATTFSAAGSTSLPDMNVNCAARMYFGDFNSDGLVDVLYQNSNSSITPGQEISFKLGMGNGNFGEAINAEDGTFKSEPFNEIPFTFLFTAGATVANVKVVDIDNDGDDDLVESNSGAPTRVILNNGGSYTVAGSTSLPAMATGCASRMYFGDFNSDGLVDVLYQNSTTAGQGISFMPGIGNGNFGDAINADETGKFDAGPFKDITFTHLNPVGATVACVKVVDIDDDGDDDLVEGNSGAPTRVILNNGGTYTVAGSTSLPTMSASCASRMFFGDFNTDGFVDVLYQNSTSSGQNISFMAGTGNGNFDTAINADAGTFNSGLFNGITFTHLLPIGNSVANVKVVDIDNDGDVDLVESNSGSATRIVLQSDAPPKISSSSPANNAINFTPTDDISITFNKTIAAAGTGSIRINKVSDDSTVFTIAGTSASILGSTVTFNPGSSLEANTAYYITIGKRAFFDTDGKTFLGVNNKTTYRFTTGDGVDMPSDITAASVSGIVAPAAGETPIEVSVLTPGAGTYTISDLTWQNNDGSPVTLTSGGKFKAGTTYRAEIELTSAAGYKFQTGGITPALNSGIAGTGTVSGGDVSGNKLSFTVSFMATEAQSVTGISVATQPTKMSYTESTDGILALNGMIITETYNDGSTADVTFSDGTAAGYTASPANGATLTNTAHNDEKVSITHTASGRTAQTDKLAVAAAPDTEITGFDAIANVNAGTAGSATYADAAAVIAALPAGVKANSNAVTVPVTTWTDTDGYNPNVAGSYTFTATLGAIPEGYANTGSHTATVEVVVAAAPDTEITGFDAIANVNAGTAGSATYADAAAVIAALPSGVKANSNAVTVPVTTWTDTDGYNPNVAGSYTFTATLGAIPEGYANTGSHTATVEVVVAAASAATDANLSSLVLSSGTLTPAFAPETSSYTVSVANGTGSITVTPMVNESHARVTVNGATVNSGSASGAINLDIGTNTITIAVTAQDNVTTKTYTITVTRSAAGSSNTSTSVSPTVQNKVIVIVNGKEEDAGKETKSKEDGKNVITVEVNNKVIEGKIEEAIKKNPEGTGNIIQIPVADTISEIAKVELTGDIVKKLEKNTFDVSIKRNNVEYLIPAEEFTISSVADKLGISEASLQEIKIEVKITKLGENVIASYNKVAEKNGAELVFPPVEFEIVAKTTKADGTTDKLEINKFSNYVERFMEIPAGVNPSKITTGIVFNQDGTYSHVPTEVFQKDVKWFAKLNSLTNSNYSVIWNPVTVAAVENHWSKEAVNDMASRLIIFNPEKFDPNKAITRADFAEYIVRALGLYREGSTYVNKFKDVKSTGDRTLGILIASEYGIVTGYPDGSFRPEALITREEAMVMYQKAMKITKLVGADTNRYQSYKDFKLVGNWATAYVKEVISAHVFNGTTANTISPKSKLTYGEAAQAIKNLLVESKLINK